MCCKVHVIFSCIHNLFSLQVILSRPTCHVCSHSFSRRRKLTSVPTKEIRNIGARWRRCTTVRTGGIAMKVSWYDTGHCYIEISSYRLKVVDVVMKRWKAYHQMEDKPFPISSTHTSDPHWVWEHYWLRCWLWPSRSVDRKTFKQWLHMTSIRWSLPWRGSVPPAIRLQRRPSNFLYLWQRQQTMVLSDTRVW